MKDNLTAWCIVPFDAKERNPEERAEMLQRLGIQSIAYDWRDKHIPEFDEEISQLAKHHIEMTFFWWRGGLPGSPETLSETEIMQTQLDFFMRNNLELEVWVTCTDEGMEQQTGDQKSTILAERTDILAGELEKIGCSLSLYNHEGWGGEPVNMVEVLKKVKSKNVGIVYNFHHGHNHLKLMPDAFHMMVPYLTCVNLNGMNENGPKILSLGQGEEDVRIMKMIKTSGYSGPIGIIGHISSEDVEVVLKRNIEGLKELLVEIGDIDALISY
ncbi:MAG: hypothetical protein ABFS38_03990 [Bacteroidota bacterium]